MNDCNWRLARRKEDKKILLSCLAHDEHWLVRDPQSAREVRLLHELVRSDKEPEEL